MARGWESKSVENQLSAAEDERENRPKPHLTPAERERHARRAGLELARTKVRSDLDAAADERYRISLRQALAHLDAEIAALG